MTIGLEFGVRLRVSDLLDVDQAQELAHRARHLPAAFVAGTAALGDTDLGPELFLVQTEAAPDFARVQDTFEQLHGRGPPGNRERHDGSRYPNGIFFTQMPRLGKPVRRAACGDEPEKRLSGAHC